MVGCPCASLDILSLTMRKKLGSNADHQEERKDVKCLYAMSDSAASEQAQSGEERDSGTDTF